MSLRWVIVVVLCAFCLLFCRFFFSSRRRHTRWPRDWSSDVCSSDLSSGQGAHAQNKTLSLGHGNGMASVKQRSEERRVGKECRSRCAPDRRKKKRRRTARSISK